MGRKVDYEVLVSWYFIVPTLQLQLGMKARHLSGDGSVSVDNNSLLI